MSLQGPLTANDAERRALADQSEAVADQGSNSEILKHPRAFLLEETRLDRIDRLNGSLHLGQSVKLDATPVVIAQIVGDDPRHEMIKPADIEAPSTRVEPPHVAVRIEAPLDIIPETHPTGLTVEATASSPPAQLIVSPPTAPEMPAPHFGGEPLDGSSVVAVAKFEGVSDLPSADPHIVAPIETAPVITSNGGGTTASVSITENATAVTTVTATDLDAASTLTYSIVGGADAAKFTVNGNTGALSFVSTPDYENPTDAGGNNVYDVTIQVSDGTLTDTQAIAVTVTDVNENGNSNAPIITSNGAGATASVNVAENATAVTTVTATDLDAGSTLTYSIIGGADAAKFTVDSGTGALSFVSAPDYETPTDVGGNNVYDVTVQVSDGTLTDTQAIAVTVTNLNDNAPVITSNGAGATASVSIAENATAVTTVTATDGGGLDGRWIDD